MPLSSTKEAAHEPVCFFLFLAVTAVAVTIPCHHCQWGPGQLLTRTNPTRTQPDYNCSQALGPQVIGPSPSSSLQQAMAHSCLATMAVKKNGIIKDSTNKHPRRPQLQHSDGCIHTGDKQQPEQRRLEHGQKKPGSTFANRKSHWPSNLDLLVQSCLGKVKRKDNENNKDIGMDVYKCLPSI